MVLEKALEKAAKNYKAPTVVGCVGFHPKVPLDLEKETRGDVVEFFTDGHNGGAERIVWETLLDMERIKYSAGERDQGAIALVLHLSKAFERVGLPVVWDSATHFNFPRKILRMLRGYFEHQRLVQLEGRVAEPLQTSTAFLPGSTWSCSL